MCGRHNVLLCILHTCSIRTGALWILISHFVISRYPGGEACALECEPSVCLEVTRGSAADLHFSISGDNSGTWLRRIRLTEHGHDCNLGGLCKKRLICFTECKFYSPGGFTRGHRLVYGNGGSKLHSQIRAQRNKKLKHLKQLQGTFLF